MQTSLIKTDSSNEWLAFISQMGLVDISKAKAIFYSGDFTQFEDLGQRALFTAGRGKTLSLEGNLPGSKQSFDEALYFAETRNAEAGFPFKDEILAYINYEMGGFFSKYGEWYNALNLFHSARRLAENTIFIRTIDYQLYAHQFENENGGSEKESIKWIDYFKQNNLQILHVISQRRLASYYRMQKEYELSLKWIDQALEQSHAYDLSFMVDQFRNARGYILFQMGRILEARETFLGLLPDVEGRYLKSTSLENLTLTFYSEKKFEEAAAYIDLAISHSRKYEILSLLPDECLFMGELQRDVFQHPEVATHYFEEGYKAALEMAEYGFALKGDRLKVVRAFEERSKVSYSIPESVGTQINPFAFSLGRSWREILDLFHFSLIRTHLLAGDGSGDLTAKLGLKASTYYAIKRRLGNAGYQFKPGETEMPLTIKQPELSAFNLYVSKLQDLTWSDANAQFESEIIEYLFKHAGYQKTKLAEELDISYPTVLQKTKTLTSST